MQWNRNWLADLHSRPQDKGRYGDMFLYALKTFSMICLGVHRFRDVTKFQSRIPSAKRYVICAPPYSFRLQSTDVVFVLAHSDVELSTSKT